MEFSLGQLQEVQDLHDRHYHTDIYNLPKKHRLAHLVLHLAKYNGRFWEIGDDPAGMARLATDAMIVLISIATLFNINLDKAFAENSLEKLVDIKRRANLPTNASSKLRDIQVGHLAKLVEAIDHVENTPDIPGTVKEAILILLPLWADVARDYINLIRDDVKPATLGESIENRLRSIEQKSIFFYRQWNIDKYTPS